MSSTEAFGEFQYPSPPLPFTLERKHQVVMLLSQQVTDRHGTGKPCSSQAYQQLAVAVPFGGCTEPTNVKAGGHSCPTRFQCSGCAPYRPGPSYLPAIDEVSFARWG
ncbi:hypothetical protein ACFWBM_11260 [Streptomyces sp. NPDC059980]|uniref:hypothetical protein n=1 Tax=Streptomyces sp. NPDC059980 TaxID=3347022 RepID=UPI00367DA1B1